MSLLVFTLAFAAGCLSGVLFGLRSRSPRGRKPAPKAAFWQTTKNDSTTARPR